ncbi:MULTISPECIES: hypothetical protein [Enterobacteriaceae]|jgi:hypothetical protein|uniref:Toll/interleukin-1 receptor domain-containing protein n=4 Tax=Enterobacteriaceae TaxID=543 RepID=I7A6Y1_SALTM|nr:MULTISPECIES: hypothetical protein [Enterobacteriaceae]AFN93940.1 hypothetical protein [Salmonella enterica subsp. enterica serovar Typhimurium]AFN93950.1 hypothetical protein [Salmonella enterica subsp. enterica serovar Typhimurium]AFN93960.1 hypothetical protein [Salmonella enterica subsp. enterica serovar Typhimurium]AFN93970.1 hypothetical protein [Salmonella enterica subsp. enterica serovar Typhimurium]KSY30187.1 hypothetical protein APU02_10320 [Citrobacter sp. 50677481]
MHKKFHIELDSLKRDLENYDRYNIVSSERLAYGSITISDRESVKQSIINYVKENEDIDTEKLIGDIFPKFTPHLFISHKSQDAGLAIKLANILFEKYDILSFIDSQVWHHINDIQKILDEEFSKKSEGLYDYRKSNIVSSNIFAMLSSSLYRTIDDSDGFIFIDRATKPNTARITHSTISQINTESPWIYLENIYSNLIRKKSHNRSQIIIAKAGLEKLAEDVSVSTESRKEPKFTYTAESVDSRTIQTIAKVLDTPYDKRKKHPLEGLDFVYSLLS